MSSIWPELFERLGNMNKPNRIASSTIKMSNRLRPELRPILNAIDPVLTGFSLRLLSLAIFVPDHIAYTADRLDEVYSEDLIDFAPQISDINVDYIGLSHVVISPDCSQKSIS